MLYSYSKMQTSLRPFPNSISTFLNHLFTRIIWHGILFVFYIALTKWILWFFWNPENAIYLIFNFPVSFNEWVGMNQWLISFIIASIGLVSDLILLELLRRDSKSA
jgi:hypothetical protein